MVTFGAAYLTMAALLILWECKRPTVMATPIAASSSSASGGVAEKAALATEREGETESLLRPDRESDGNDDDLE